MIGGYHMNWETNPDENLPDMPGGADWLAQIEAERPDPAERHLAVHFGHCTHLNDADRKAIAAYGDAIPWFGWVGEADAVRARGEQSAAAGMTEILYTPAGDDLIGQAEAWYAALSKLQTPD